MIIVDRSQLTQLFLMQVSYAIRRRHWPSLEPKRPSSGRKPLSELDGLLSSASNRVISSSSRACRVSHTTNRLSSCLVTLQSNINPKRSKKKARVKAWQPRYKQVVGDVYSFVFPQNIVISVLTHPQRQNHGTHGSALPAFTPPQAPAPWSSAVPLIRTISWVFLARGGPFSPSFGGIYGGSFIRGHVSMGYRS